MGLLEFKNDLEKRVNWRSDKLALKKTKTLNEASRLRHELDILKDVLITFNTCVGETSNKESVLPISGVSNSLFCGSCEQLAEHKEFENGDLKCSNCGYVAKL